MSALPDPRETLAGDDLAIYQRMMAFRVARGKPLHGPYIPLMNHPRLAERIEAMGRFLRYEGSLPRDLYEFAVLCFAANNSIVFEWDDHVGPAREAGVPDEVIAALEDDEEVPSPYHEIGLILRLMQEYRSIPASIQEKVVALVGTEGLLELAAVCGFYALLGHVICGFDVRPAVAQTSTP